MFTENFYKCLPHYFYGTRRCAYNTRISVDANAQIKATDGTMLEHLLYNNKYGGWGNYSATVYTDTFSLSACSIAHKTAANHRYYIGGSSCYAPDGGCAVVLGSGTTAAAVNDYCLENDKTNKFTFSDRVIGNIFYDDINNKFYRTVQILATYLGESGASSPLTISEWGIVYYYGDPGNNNPIYPILVSREIMDQSITVTDPGDCFTINYTVSVNV